MPHVYGWFRRPRLFLRRRIQRYPMMSPLRPRKRRYFSQFLFKSLFPYQNLFFIYSLRLTVTIPISPISTTVIVKCLLAGLTRACLTTSSVFRLEKQSYPFYLLSITLASLTFVTTLSNIIIIRTRLKPLNLNRCRT